MALFVDFIDRDNYRHAVNPAFVTRLREFTTHAGLIRTEIHISSGAAEYFIDVPLSLDDVRYQLLLTRDDATVC